MGLMWLLTRQQSSQWLPSSLLVCHSRAVENLQCNCSSVEGLAVQRACGLILEHRSGHRLRRQRCAGCNDEEYVENTQQQNKTKNKQKKKKQQKKKQPEKYLREE